MVMSFFTGSPSPANRPKEEDADCRRPTLAELAAQAERALRERRGTDVTGLSYEQRDKIFFGK